MNKQHAFYITVIIVVSFAVHLAAAIVINQGMDGDEQRYLDQASRLLSGEDMYPNGRIVNPPLLPGIFALAQNFGISIDYLPVLGILAIVLATTLLFVALTSYCSPKIACITALFLPLHPAIIMLGSQLMSEPFAILFAVSALLLIRRLYSRTSVVVSVIFLAIVFAALAMLKPLFGYVLTVSLFLSIILFIAIRDRLRHFFAMTGVSCCMALVLCSPFLAFTYLETGKIFKWSTGTGDHVYWMSIGGEDVWGSWVPDHKVNTIPFVVKNGYADEMNAAMKMHQSDRDIYLQSLAFERISSDPSHLIVNIIANTGRVLFNYPFSFRPQSLFTYGYILPNMALYFLLLVSFALLPITWRKQDISLAWMHVFFLIYLAGNMLVGSTGRQGLVFVPCILLWLSSQLHILKNLGILNLDIPIDKKFDAGVGSSR